MLLMIDNYDSFTYNVVQYLGELGAQVRVVRNDEITVQDIEGLAPDKIVISPGPCTPNEAGISMEVIQTYAGKLPLFGGLDGARFRRQVGPGDTLELVAEMTRLSARAGKGRGEARLNGEVATSCELMFVIVDADAAS